MRELSPMAGSVNPLPTKRSKVETGLIFFLPEYTLRIMGSCLQEDRGHFLLIHLSYFRVIYSQTRSSVPVANKLMNSLMGK